MPRTKKRYIAKCFPAKVNFVLLLLMMFCQKAIAESDNALVGKVIGTALSVNMETGASSLTENTKECAFDGNPNTYFAAYEQSQAWVGLDLGTPHVINGVGWTPWNTTQGAELVQLGVFEGANSPDFTDAIPLHIINQEQPSTGEQYAMVEVSRAFRYVRYVGPSESRCQVAEVQFYGQEGEGSDNLFSQLTNLPTVCIHTEDGTNPVDKINEKPAYFTLIYSGGTRIQEGMGTVRLRGNTSMNYEKKPYRIRFDKKTRVLEGSKVESPARARKWTLINPYDDKTLMRNIVGFEVARRMQMDYVPYCQAVDVIVNGEYKGCYQLSDQVTVDKDRINIAAMEPEDKEEPNISGGYFLEMDGLAGYEESWFQSKRGIPVTIKEPDSKSINAIQRYYIENYFNLMEQRLFAADYRNEKTGYRTILDLESFLRHFMTSEFTANSDMYWSTYIYKDRGDSLFRVGPVWDMNLAFDNDGRSYPNKNAPDWTYLFVHSYAGTTNLWAERILSDPLAQDSLRSIWKHSKKENNMTNESLLAYVDSMALHLSRSQQLNFRRWKNMNDWLFNNPQIAGSYDGEVKVLKDFIRNRFVWIDNKLNKKYSDGSDKTFEISTAAELEDFAQQVLADSMKCASAILMADIDLRDWGRNITIGSARMPYMGEFNGNGHTIWVDIERTENDAALFGYLGGTVRNLEVRGNIRTSAKFAAGIAAHLYGGNILQCASLVDIESSLRGDGTHAGIVAVTDKGGKVEDCLFAGTINGEMTECCGGIVGWATTTTTINNCLQIGEFTVSKDGSHTLSRNYSQIIGTGNLYLNTLGETGTGNIITESQLQSGEICYRLNGKKSDNPNWYQNLDNGKTIDTYPTPIFTHGTVYFNQNKYTNTDHTNYIHLVDEEKKQISTKWKFDLQGRRLYEIPYRNIFIQDGKKKVIQQ